MSAANIPKTQTVALVNELGGEVQFKHDYPVPTLQRNEVLAKVLYTGVCQSDLHTKNGTASGPDGRPITAIKLPHVGGHEGVGRIVAIGEGCSDDIKLGGIVGIRFASRICRRCEFCLAGTEQYCVKSTNHLHNEDGAFQEYIALDAGYLCILPDDVNPEVIGPVLCAGLTAYKAVMNANAKPGQWLIVLGAGGGLGHFAGGTPFLFFLDVFRDDTSPLFVLRCDDLSRPKVQLLKVSLVQYARAQGVQVIGIDGGDEKGTFVKSIGAEKYIDFTKTTDLVQEVIKITGGGAHAVIVTAGNAKAFVSAAEMLRVRGTLSCVGIPPGKAVIETGVSTIVIKGLHITGNLVGSLKECLEAVDFVRRGVVKSMVSVRPFRDLPQAYEDMEKGNVMGRIVLKIAKE